MLLAEFRSQIDTRFISKAVGDGTNLRPVTVSGSSGWWIEGEPHVLTYLGSGDQRRDESSRLAANTLLWEVGGTTLRLESSLTLTEVLPIAESVE